MSTPFPPPSAIIYLMQGIITETGQVFEWYSSYVPDFTASQSPYPGGIDPRTITVVDCIVDADVESVSLSGDVTGTSSSSVVSAIQGVTISGSPTAGEVLTAVTPTTATWIEPNLSLGVITVGTSGSAADYVCTGTNDDIVINQAIIHAVSIGVSTVIMLPGSYYLGNQIVLQSNITLTAMELGTVEIFLATYFNFSGNTAGIYATGSYTTGVGIVLSSNLVDGYNYLNYTASSESANLAAENWLFMESNTLWETTEQSGRTISEFMRVNEIVDSTQLVIYGWARSTYLTSASATFYRVSFCNSPQISNLNVSQASPLGSITDPVPLVAFNQCWNASVKNCILHDNDQAGVLDQFSIGTTVADSFIYKLTDHTALTQYGYGIQAHGAEHAKYERNTIYRVRHAMTTGGGSNGISRNINFSGNTVTYCTNSAVDTHNQSETVLIANNAISNSLSNGVFVRGRSTVVSNNAIEWCGTGVQVGLDPYQVSGGSGTGTSVIGNKIRNMVYGNSPELSGNAIASGYGIVLDLTDNVTVQGNICENIQEAGMALEHKVKNCVIRDNLFLNCNLLNIATYCAIQMYANFSTTAGSITTVVGSTCTFTYSGTAVQNYFPGQTVVITGAASSANNGSFTIIAMISDASFTYTNASGVANDANNGAITVRVENVTDNIIENNTAVNTAASEYDPNSTGGNMYYFCFDYGTNSAGSNVRNTFRNNQAYGMLTGLYNQQNSANTYAQLANNTYLEGRNFANTADLDLIGVFTNNAVTVGDSTNGVAVNLTSNAGEVNILNSGSTFISINGSATGTCAIGAVSTCSGFGIDISNSAVNSATGVTLSINGQNMTGTTSVGGNVVLNSGSGTSTNGKVLLQIDGTTIGQFNQTSTDFLAMGGSTIATAGLIRVPNAVNIIEARNAANSANIVCLSTDSSNDVIIGDGANNRDIYLNVPVNGVINFESASSNCASFTLNNTGANTLTFGATVTGVQFTINAATSDVAPANFTWTGQKSYQSAVTNLTGGAMVIQCPDGYTAAGAGGGGTGGSLDINVGQGGNGFGQINLRIGQSDQVGTMYTMVPSGSYTTPTTMNFECGNIMTAMTYNHTALASTSASSGSVGSVTTIQAQAGQAATGASNNGGAGGQLILSSGVGGTSGSATAGSGGTLKLQVGGTTQASATPLGFSFASSTVTVNTNGTTNLTAAQMATPVLIMSTATQTGLMTLNFGGAIGQFWVDFSAITNSSDGLAFKNGSQTITVTTLWTLKTLFLVSCETTNSINVG